MKIMIVREFEKSEKEAKRRDHGKKNMNLNVAFRSIYNSSSKFIGAKWT